MNSNKTLIVGEFDLELPQPVSDLEEDAVVQIGMALRMLLADAFALYIKTKNFHWHMRGAHFRDHHLLLDEQAEQIFGMVDDIAERTRKIGARTIRSIADIGSHQRLSDNSELDVTPRDMLAELCMDSLRMTSWLRSTHRLCSEHGDVATTSLLENWIDEAERRSWFLHETVQDSASGA